MEGHQSVELVRNNAGGVGRLGPDPGAGEATQGLEKAGERSCNKSPAQQGLRPGRWEVYKRDEIRVEPQRQSVSQAATTCLDTSRRPLAPIPVSQFFDGSSKQLLNQTLF